MKFNNTLKTVVKNDVKNGLIPMLLGEPGIGKSSWVEDLAKDMKTKCFTLAVNQLADKADLTGARLIPEKDKNGNTTYKQFFYPHAIIHDAIEYAKENPDETPILFMDELNRTTPDVTSEALSIPTLRSIGSVKLPDNLRVITAGNDKGNITSLDEASISRFVLYNVIPDTETFINLDDNLNEYVKKTLEENEDLIFCKKSMVVVNEDEDEDNIYSESLSVDDFGDFDEDMNQITTPRTIMGASKWLNSLSDFEIKSLITETTKIDDEEVSVLEECIKAHVGETLFATKLIENIIEDFRNKTITISSEKPDMPTCFNDIKAIGKRDKLEEKIQSLDKETKEKILIYALYESSDNSNIIETISKDIDTVSGKSLQKIITIVNQRNLNQDNYDTLINDNTKLSQYISGIMQAFRE